MRRHDVGATSSGALCEGAPRRERPARTLPRRSTHLGRPLVGGSSKSQRLDFTGIVAATTSEALEAAGVGPEEGAAQATTQRAHVEVAVEHVEVAVEAVTSSG
jgi:hypothetical protein